MNENKLLACKIKWYWLILELLIIFGVMAWVYFFPSEDIYDDFGKGLIGSVLFCCVEEIRKRMGENYTVEQNAGENQNEWHYVKDGDLPKEEDLVLFKTDVDYYIGKIDYSKKCWWTGFCRDDSISNSFVIAWCEIPKYTQE